MTKAGSEQRRDFRDGVLDREVRGSPDDEDGGKRQRCPHAHPTQHHSIL
jgi:hypothetical protein